MKIFLTLPMMVAALCISSLGLADQIPASMDVKQAAKLQMEGAFLLDVREPEEFAVVHAKNAILIPLGQLPSRIGELVQYKLKPVAVICHTGRRSAKGAEILRNAGFTEVANVEGGTNAWINAGLPVIRK